MIIAPTKERILQYLDLKKISKQTFFAETGIKRGFLDADKIKGAVSDISLTKIIAAYNQYGLNFGLLPGAFLLSLSLDINSILVS